jgi:hypothetical protein
MPGVMSQEKIRHFVRLLRNHLGTLTPAALYGSFNKVAFRTKGARHEGLLRDLQLGALQNAKSTGL